MICEILIHVNKDEDNMELIKDPIGRSIASIIYEEKCKLGEDLVNTIYKLMLNSGVRLF